MPKYINGVGPANQNGMRSVPPQLLTHFWLHYLKQVGTSRIMTRLNLDDLLNQIAVIDRRKPKAEIYKPEHSNVFFSHLVIHHF